MPPNLANTLYFRLQDQNRQNQLLARDAEKTNADYLMRAGAQVEEQKQNAFERELAQAKALGENAAAEGRDAPRFTNSNFTTEAGIGAGGVKRQQSALRQKGQLLRDIETMKEGAAGRRDSANQNAQTDRAGIAAQSAEDVARINQGGLSYRAKKYPRVATPAKPPSPFDPKWNPAAAKAQDLKAQIAANAKIFRPEVMDRLGQELRKAEAEARVYAKLAGMDVPDVPDLEPDAAARTAGPVQQAPDTEAPPTDDEFDQYLK